jgi:hypothetical protein
MKLVLQRIFRQPWLHRPVRQVSRLHRWLGTGFCVLFALWFGTGFVMMYVPFPALPEGARIAASAPVDLAAVSVAPAAALHGLAADRLRLVQVLERPRYLVTLRDGTMRSVAADGADMPPALTEVQAAQLAGRFTQRPVRSVSGPLDYDQWVVHQHFDAARPFYRVALEDAAGTEVYVSSRLGQVLQRTTRFERGWNWVGAVVHWMYPTILRKSLWAWDQLVWWLSLAAAVVAASGYALGLTRTATLRRSRRAGVSPGLSPYRGWLRWHHVLGLVGGAFALTWIISGWLSMDHGRLFSSDQPTAAHVARFRGAQLASAMARLTPETLRELPAARELEFVVLGGEGFVVARGLQDGAVRIFLWKDGKVQAPLEAMPAALVARAAARAWAPVRVRDVASISADDPYAHTRSDPLPPDALRVRIDDAAHTWLHVDARSGQILSQMDDSRRAYRWLYNGLHTFDFPFLNKLGLLRQSMMLAALAAGLGLSISGIVLGARRLQRGARARRREMR